MKAKLYNAKELYQYKYIQVFLKPLSALMQENFVINPVSNFAISLCASSTELTYPKLSACLPSMVRDLKFSLCCFCLFLKNHGIYSFECSATSLADFRESSVMFCKSLNIPSQSLSTEVFRWMESNADLMSRGAFCCACSVNFSLIRETAGMRLLSPLKNCKRKEAEKCVGKNNGLSI